MNPQLNHLLATHRSAELRRAAERARLAEDDRVAEAASQQDGLAARTTVRLRLRVTGRGRLRARKA